MVFTFHPLALQIDQLEPTAKPAVSLMSQLKEELDTSEGQGINRDETNGVGHLVRPDI